MAIKISEYVLRLNDFKVDYNYQRPSGVWSLEDKQCFIDTILVNLPVPLFFFNKTRDTSGNVINYVVDGQQRLDCIREFFENKYPLSAKFSEKALDGKYYKDLNETNKRKFLNYSLQEKTLDSLSDEKVRSIFSRLQRGKPLNLNEKLNAFPGDIVPTVRKVRELPFFLKSIKNEHQKGYRMISVIGRMLYYEFYGLKDVAPYALRNFFEEKKDLKYDSPEVKKTIRTLNYLHKVFPNSNEGIYVFSGDAWILAIYMMVSRLLEEYSLIDLEIQISTFLRRFWRNIYDKQIRQSDSDYNDFYDRVRGGWSQKNQTTRRDILLEKFLSDNEKPVLVLDSNRQITNDEKMSIFASNPKCEICKCDFTTYNEGEYHHRIRWADGGKTTSDNIMLLCVKCHTKLHHSDVSLKISEIVVDGLDENEENDEHI